LHVSFVSSVSFNKILPGTFGTIGTFYPQTDNTDNTDRAFFSYKVPKVSIVPSHFFLHGDIDDIGDIANFAKIASAFFLSFWGF